jgi:TRAP-type C4-dicarboxylate transport system permease small subunit
MNNPSGAGLPTSSTPAWTTFRVAHIPTSPCYCKIEPFLMWRFTSKLAAALLIVYKGVKLVKFVNQVLYTICNLLHYVAAAMLFFVCLIVLLNILFRNFLNAPIIGTNELVQYGMLFAICFVLAHVTMRDGHVKVTLLSDKLPIKIRNIVAILVDCISFFGFFLFFNSMYRTSVEAMSSGQYTSIFKIPLFVVYIAIMAGVGLMGFLLITKTIEKILSLFRDEVTTSQNLTIIADKKE